MAITGRIELWHVYLLTFLFGTAAALDVPARQAFVNEMVDPEHLANAVGLELGLVQPGAHDRSGARRCC